MVNHLDWPSFSSSQDRGWLPVYTPAWKAEQKRFPDSNFILQNYVMLPRKIPGYPLIWKGVRRAWRAGGLLANESGWACFSRSESKGLAAPTPRGPFRASSLSRPTLDIWVQGLSRGCLGDSTSSADGLHSVSIENFVYVCVLWERGERYTGVPVSPPNFQNPFAASTQSKATYHPPPPALFLTCPSTIHQNQLPFKRKF